MSVGYVDPTGAGGGQTGTVRAGMAGMGRGGIAGVTRAGGSFLPRRSVLTFASQYLDAGKSGTRRNLRRSQGRGEIGANMNKNLIKVAALLVVALPYAAHAQGPIRGAEEGAAAGDRAAGPLGAIVGGAIGAATGTVGGILGLDDRPRFREYVVRERHPSFRFSGDIRVGTVLPARGVRLYDVPVEYHVGNGYRYAIVNDRPVLVEPRSRRIVEIIE